jgi:hypothetical protein
MTVFTLFLNVAGERMEVGSVSLENPDLNEFESVELIEQDVESTDDAITVAFTPA